MSKFNTKSVEKLVKSFEGGDVYEKSLEDEWTNVLFSSLMGGTFYESADEQQDRFIELTRAMLDKYGFDFVARAAHFSRNEIGLRSISELTAAILNDAKSESKREFYKNYFHRPDGVAEVFSAVKMLGGKRSHALVKGAADYISSLSDYQLAKYKMVGKDWNIYDLVNVTHAKSDAIDRLKAGETKSADTWEVRISNSKSVEEKESNWKQLVEEGKLGYLALLRNLRNICACSFATPAWLGTFVSPQLTDEVKIKKSLVWPYQIYSAYKAMKGSVPLPILVALNSAFISAIGNMPYFDGETLLVLDVSGSMDAPISVRSDMSIKETSAVYCAALYLSNPNAVFYKFGNEYKRCKYNRNMMPFDIIHEMCKNKDCGYGTDILPVFKALDQHYDRMFLFSDMQVMSELSYWSYGKNDMTPEKAFKKFMKKFGKCQIYSYDLANYHTQLTKSSNDSIKYITALNDSVIKFISILESGKSIVDYINENYKPY